MTNTGHKILLVDDEENLLIGLQAVIKRAGYTVVATQDGNDALNLARTEKPELIICDIMMPSPNGIEIRKFLNDDPSLSDIPFIFLTARSTQPDIISGLNLGADDYITKPFNIDELMARIQAVFRRSKKNEDKTNREIDQKMEELRKGISSNLGHELRTPLSVLINTLELALRSTYGEDNPCGKEEYIDMALRNAYRMKNLTDDLIILSEIDQNRLNTFRSLIDLKFNFSNPIQSVFEYWKTKKQTTTVEISEGVVIHAPRAGFSHAVTHLVDNACKFTPAGGMVHVSLFPNGQGGCRLVVADSGSGIPKELREKVFERFYQASQGDARSYPGLGVGLTIARAIARSLGGDVQILDASTGCTVEMLLPSFSLDWTN
jgi:signal transduction histidine kinase